MKYIITENRLNKVIFNYLDMEFAGLKRKKGKHYDVIFKLPNEERGILGWKKSGSLLISSKIFENISYLFGLNETDSEKIIGEWVKDRYNLKVNDDDIFIIAPYSLFLS